MKRVLSLLLSFVLVFSLCGAAFAADQTPAAAVSQSGYDGYPFVLVRGMQFADMTYNTGTPQEEDVFPGVTVNGILKTAVKAIGQGLLYRDINKFTDALIAYAKELLGGMACDENGQSKYELGVESYPHALSNYPDLVNHVNKSGYREYGILKAAVENYGAENVYYYHYDWRLDPFMHADKIDEIINNALAETGKDKVNLACASMGGILTDAYLTKYGAEKLNRVLFLSSTFYGTYVTSDLLRGEVAFSGETIYNFLQAMLAQDNRGLHTLFSLLRKMGLFRLLDRVVNWLVPAIKDRVYDEFLRDIFGTMPTVWALVLPQYYDACIQYMFGGMEDKYAGLIALTEQYQTMAKNRDAMLKQMMADGLTVCVVANYDLPVVPVYAHGTVQGDTVLESALMLGGAVVSDYGETLPADYVPASSEHLSADRMVDLSGALLPENTWAIKGAPHVACDYGTDYSRFIFWLLAVNEQPTVRMTPQYPQFMQSSGAQELVPLK